MKSSSWFTETEVFLMHEIVARFDRLARRLVLDDHGISYAEFLIAMAVREMGRPTQNEVCELLDTSKSLVSQRVGALAAKNILVQHRDAENRRQVRLELTPTGRETLETIYGELATHAAPAFEAMGAARPGFRTALLRLRDALIEKETEGAGGTG
ncbi:MarR family winged helix-turn-helix transcriptional regulator [Pinisolibacter sp.]|uniref:MarR family winged helix-turn-helix transcriptional regulator n=1 Tax=Pinisolibacter sp. TaxID=2172024 RepID=UPI002FDD8599